jgi:hypothetical protein
VALSTFWHFRRLAQPSANTRRWKPVLSNLISSDVYLMASADLHLRGSLIFPFTILLLTILKNVFHFQAGADLIVKKLIKLPSLFGYVPRKDFHGNRNAASRSAAGCFGPDPDCERDRRFYSNRSDSQSHLAGSHNMSFLKTSDLVWRDTALYRVVSAFVIAGGISLHFIQLASFTTGRIHRTFSSRCWDLYSRSHFSSSCFAFCPTSGSSWTPRCAHRYSLAVVWELGKYAYLWSLGKLDLSGIYGPYFTSAVVLILWSYISAMIMILGAELAHRELLS